MQELSFQNPIHRRIAVALGLFLAWVGLFIVLQAFGVIRSTDDFGLPARIIATLFGLSASLGAYLVLKVGLEPLLAETVGCRGPFPWRLVLYLPRRINLRTLGAALPFFLLAAECFIAMRTGDTLPFIGKESLQDLIPMEFLLLHSTVFLGLLALWGAEGLALKLKRACFVAMALLYLGLGWQNLSVGMFVHFVFLASARYVAHWSNPPGLNALIATGQRWLGSFLTFMLVVALVGNTNMKGPGNVPAAAWYFSCLGLFELFALFEFTGTGSSAGSGTGC